MAAAADYSAEATVSTYMKDLLRKAEDYCFGSFDDVTVFYRNKPRSYFSNLKDTDMIMRKIVKDGGGDPKSPINGRLAGVFFGVTLHKGSLPTISPFGEMRVQVPIEEIFSVHTNLYFTDFYCFKGTNHYVTLVLTKKESSADIFCKANLPKIDPMNNKFLKRVGRYCPKFMTASQSRLIVEIFYTEDVDLKELSRRTQSVFFDETRIYGKGHSTLGGIRKNRLCHICNIGGDVSPLYGLYDGLEEYFSRMSMFR